MKKTADALAEVDEDFREKILDQLSAKEIAEEVKNLILMMPLISLQNSQKNDKKKCFRKSKIPSI